MDLSMPPMPFSAVCVPTSGNTTLRIPADMRNEGLGNPPNYIELPVGVVQVIVTWKGVDPLLVRHYTGNTSTYDTVATIPASSTVNDRSTGVLTLASDKRHGVLVLHGSTTGTNWNADTLSKGYVAGVQVMPMGTAADITGGGSLLRVDNSVGTRVFLGDLMIHGDTGDRDLRGMLPEGWSATTFKLRRVGQLVTIAIVELKRDASNGSVSLPDFIPTDFLPTPRHMFNLVGVNYVQINTAGGMSFIGPTGSNIQGVITYHTHKGWPTSLPGTAL